MSSWFNFWSSPLKGDAHEERLKISRWLGPSRVLKFNEENSVTIPEGILSIHPKFFALWADNQTLDMTGISRQVAHVVVNYLYTGAYENLQILRPTSEARNHVDFTTAVQVHNIGVEYHLTELRQLASERITIYGDETSLWSTSLRYFPSHPLRMYRSQEAFVTMFTIEQTNKTK